MRGSRERPRSEAGLAAEILQALMAGLSASAARFDREGRHLLVWGNGGSTAGDAASRFAGRTHRELGFSEELCCAWEEAIRKVFETGTPLETELTFAGAVRPVRCRLVPEFGAQDAVESVLAICRAGAGPSQPELDYAPLFREMQYGVALHEIIRDDQGRPSDFRVLAVNPAFERMTGLRAADLVGRPAREALPGFCGTESYGRVATTGEPAHLESHAGQSGKSYEVTVLRAASEHLACLLADTTWRRREAEALKGLAASFAELSGKPLFEAVCRQIATALGVDYVLAGQAGGGIVRSLGGYARGEPMEEAGFPLADSPCGTAPGPQPRVYPSGVQSEFPKDPLLARWGIQGYIGAHILDERGESMGILAALHTAPLPDAQAASRLFGACLDRVAAEMRRMRAQEALANSEERTRLFFERQLVGMAITSPEKRWLQVNNRLCAMLGYSSAELAGLTWAELTHPEDLAADLSQFSRLLAGEIDEYSLEKRFIRKDGSIIHTDLSVACVRHRDRSMDYALALFVDITERKKAEEALRQSEHRFRSIIQGSSDIILVLDEDASTVYESPSAARILGFPPGYLLGRSPMFLVHPEDAGRIGKDLEAVAAGINPGTPIWFRVRRADGSWIHLEAVGSNQLQNPAVRGIVITARDVTGRKRAEEALRESEERFGELANAALEGVVIHAGGTILDTNLAFARLFGYDRPEDLIGSSGLDSLLTPESRELVRHRMEQRLSGRVELTGVRKDGSVFAMEAEARPVKYLGRDVRLVACRDITERKRSEEALRESQERYRALFERSLDCVFLTDFQGRFLDANQAALDLIGYRREEISSLTVESLLEKNQLPLASQTIEQIRATGHQRTPAEYRLRRKDGTPVIVEALSSLIYHEGKPFALQGIARDVTARKKAEEDLRLSRAQLLANLENTPNVAVQWYDEQGRVLYWNRASEALYGWKPGEANGKTLDELILSPEEAAEFLRILERVRASGEPFGPFETLVHRKDGASGWVLATTFAIPISEGRTGFVRMDVDITERKRAEQELRTREARLSSLLRTAPIGIGISVNRVVTGANEALARLLGYTVEELIGASTRIFHRDDSEFVKEAERRAGTPNFNSADTQWRRKDGSLVDVNVSNSLVDPEDVSKGVVFTVVDLTERKRSEAEREKLQIQLHHSQKMESIGRLAGGVAHDFNNLLTIINGYSHLLLGRLNENDPLRATVTEIQKAGERAAGLTRQLLAFSRKQLLEPRPLDLNDVLREMRPMLARLMGEDIEVTLALNAECGAISADPHQLDQVIMNLAVNARDAMPSGGTLLIETAWLERDESYARSHPEARAGRYVMVAVSDSGVGMDEQTRQRIFEPFFTTKEAGQGTGLGLAMVQGIVAQSGGFINVYSEPGRGTTFKIYLPALAEAGSRTEIHEAAPPPGGGETVLVVEDQADVRNFVAAALKTYGYHVITAAGAGEALRVCEREPGHIDLVLTDVVMPKSSGRELADRLAALRPEIKVLFMSGYTDNVIAHHGVLEEGVQFIEKPFSPEKLARKVRAVLGPPAQAVRVLVADDEAAVRSFLRTVLERAGYEVLEAGDGKETLQRLRTQHVDLVIVDLVMPELEGIETIQILRRENPGLRIIAISGAFDGQFLKTARLLGADEVLSKPVSAEMLLARTAELLKHRA